MPDRHPHRLTLRPPRGWNSYNCYGCSANQRVVASNIQAFADRLQPAGYEYFVIDNGWFGEYLIEPGEEFTREKHASDVRLDEHGRLLPSQVSFPAGLQKQIDRTHELGIKFGVHLMRGVPRKAVAMKLPVDGADGITCADIADTSDTCGWCDYMYGVDINRPGAQAYYDSVFRLLASWGIDFVKVDDIIHKPREIEAVADAIERCGRDMVLSLSPGRAMDPAYLDIYKRADIFRITSDIWDRREDLDKVFDRWEEIQDLPLDGLWPDLDMIPFGKLMVWNPGDTREDCKQLAGWGVARTDQFTPAQRRTFITQRALAASPLFMGGELALSDDDVFDLITNEDMLVCNANGIVGRLNHRHDGIDVWHAPHRERPGAGWFGVFNRNTSPWSGPVELAAAGIKTSPDTLWSIWDRTVVQPEGGRLACKLDADDVLFVRYGDHSE